MTSKPRAKRTPRASQNVVGDLLPMVAFRGLARRLERMNTSLADMLHRKDWAKGVGPLVVPTDPARDLAEAARHLVECVLARPDLDDATRRWWIDHTTMAYRVLLGYDTRGRDSYVGVSRLLADALDASVVSGLEERVFFVRYWLGSFYPDLERKLDEDALRDAIRKWTTTGGRPRRGQRGGKWIALRNLVHRLGLAVPDAQSVHKASQRRAATSR